MSIRIVDTHASEHAVKMLLQRTQRATGQPIEKEPVDLAGFPYAGVLKSACGRTRDARVIVVCDGKQETALPTCQQCRVLLDEARQAVGD